MSASARRSFPVQRGEAPPHDLPELRRRLGDHQRGAPAVHDDATGDTQKPLSHAAQADPFVGRSLEQYPDDVRQVVGEQVEQQQDRRTSLCANESPEE